MLLKVNKRLEDVNHMCEKKKLSLKKMASRLPRPVHAVTPEPAVPFHLTGQTAPAQMNGIVNGSPLHHSDSKKSPKLPRRSSKVIIC